MIGHAIFAFLFGFIGLLIGEAITAAGVKPYLWSTHVDGYVRCVKDGAPRDNCIDKYLLSMSEDKS